MGLDELAVVLKTHLVAEFRVHDLELFLSTAIASALYTLQGKSLGNFILRDVRRLGVLAHGCVASQERLVFGVSLVIFGRLLRFLGLDWVTCGRAHAAHLFNFYFYQIRFSNL